MGTKEYSFNVSGDPPNSLIYLSKAMYKLIEQARTAAKYPATILIQGESGTGKDLLAQFIHYSSPLYNKKFLAVNCATFQDTLIDTELFGYEKGSFTGALSQGKIGLFEQADGGMVFLDEISELPLNLQGKLLRFVQDKKIRRIGSTVIKPVDVRIIAATNRNLLSEVENRRFRKYLYYRLAVLNLYIPPLREWPEDIIALARYYLKNFCTAYDIKRTLDDDAMEALCRYQWPGNVRELINTIESLVIINPTTSIRRADLPLEYCHSDPARPCAACK